MVGQIETDHASQARHASDLSWPSDKLPVRRPKMGKALCEPSLAMIRRSNEFPLSKI
jgi:hypothetical protein